MKSAFLLVGLGFVLAQPALAESNLRTIHDLPETERNQLNTLFAAYRHCMADSPLPAADNRQQAQHNANTLMQHCDAELVTAQDLMLAHDISEGLAKGLTNNMRSRAARDLMARAMNTLAAQAAATAEAENP